MCNLTDSILFTYFWGYLVLWLLTSFTLLICFDLFMCLAVMVMHNHSGVTQQIPILQFRPLEDSQAQSDAYRFHHEDLFCLSNGILDPGLFPIFGRETPKRGSCGEQTWMNPPRPINCRSPAPLIGQAGLPNVRPATCILKGTTMGNPLITSMVKSKDMIQSDTTMSFCEIVPNQPNEL